MGGGGGNGRRIFLVKNRPVGCRRILIAGRLKSILNSKNGLLSLESRIGRPVMLIGDSGREKKKKKENIRFGLFDLQYLIAGLVNLGISKNGNGG